MPELGHQLEREGSRVELAPGALGRFEARLRRRQWTQKVGIYVVALTVGVLGVVSAVAALGGRTQVAPATSPSTPTVRSSDVLPPGMYWTPPLTRSQLIATLRANGFGKAREVQHFFEDLGAFSHTVRFGIQVRANGIWNQFQQRDQGPREGGWSGAYRATGPQEMTVLGYGCTIRYGISRSGGQVLIKVLTEQGPSYKGICGERDLVAQTAIYDTASFSRHSQSP